MITRWGVELPEAHELPALPRGVVLHWTGGGPRANEVDLRAYHYVVEADGRVAQGTNPVERNMRKITSGPYAQHTGGWNSYRVGLAAAGMAGYRSRSTPGSAPLTAIQVTRLLELACYFLRMAKLSPLSAEALCTHLEVWTLHGVKGQTNDTKLDIEFLSFKPELRRDQVGPFLRRTAMEIMMGGAPDLPKPPPAVAVSPPAVPELNLQVIERPRVDHIDRLGKMKGLTGDVLEATGKQALEVVETMGRRVLAGGKADLKDFVDVIADYLKSRL
jgi:hypothetical protein